MEETNNSQIPWVVLFAVVAGGFVALLVSSSVNVALPRLMAIFGVNAGSIQWVITSYTLVSGIIVPITGYLTMRYGSKRMYILALAIFTVGSVLCAVSWNNTSLVVARIIQAVGGGMINPVGMAIIYMHVPRDKMGMAMGVFGVAVTVAPAIGPTVGGYLVDHLNWEWIFIMNIPISLAAIFLSAVALKETPRQTGLKPDVMGIITCTCACFSLLLALSQGTDKGWSSLYIVNLFIFSGFSFVLFVLWELNFPQPLINMKLFNNRTFCVSLLAVSIMTVGLYAGTFFIPLYAQTAMGFTPMQTGLMMMPAAVVTALMMPVSGRLFDKVGAMPLCIVGFAIIAYYTYGLHNLGVNTSISEIRWMLVKRSLGLGLAMMPMSTVGMNTIPKLMVSQGSALNNLVRMISISIGLPCLTVTMTHRQIYHAARLRETVTWSSPAAVSAIGKLKGVLFLRGIPQSHTSAASLGLLSRNVSLNAFISGINDLFIVAAGLMAAAIPLGLFLSKRAAEAETEKQNRQFGRMLNNIEND
ncbi:MAG: DHA2 family efflux MFS transporter permease subunit [Syntrophomonadaceae bacterium]|nr:DHA2 family efflux MFS transporter permease subunit [Syntrophomonadaceae bacterium]